MKRLTSHALAVVCLLALSFACSGSKSGGQPDSGPTTCSSTFDCPPFHDSDGGTRPQVCVASACIPTCASNSQCTTGNVCEDGICTAPGCGAASDCPSSQICSGGSCVGPTQASTVSSCDITPNPAVVNQGKTLQLTAVAKTAGKAVPFSGFSWQVTSGTATIDANTGVLTATAAGAIAIKANVGPPGSSVSCTSNVTIYPPAAGAGSVRVVVIDEFTKKPVTGANVVISMVGAPAPLKTDGQGAATFSAVGAGPYTLHVFAAGYDYFSIINTPNADVLVPLMPHVANSTRSGFSGTMAAADFAPLNLPGQSVHLAFFGSSIPGSPIDIGIQTLIGQLRPVSIALTGSKPVTVNLPSSLILGISDNMFDTQNYKLFAEQGERVLWGLGGNLDFTTVATALSPILSGGTANLDIGSLLTQLLPLVGKLQAGQLVGQAPPANGANPTFTNVTIPLNTLLRLRAVVKLPDLPKQDGKYLGGAVALGGALAYPQGFVPLGLTAGLANKDAGGANTATVVDPTCDTSGGTAACATGKLPVRVAPFNNGLESSSWGFLALALNLDALNIGNSAASAVGLAGIVKPVPTVNYTAPPADGQVIDMTTRGYMSMPGAGTATLTAATRVIALPAAPDASTKFVRVGVQAHEGLNWNIWAPSNAAAATITLPDPHAVDATLVDPLGQTMASDGTTGGASSLALHVSLTGTTAFKDVSGFGNITLDQLGANVDAFTLVTVPVQ
jgi:hypothetical protein